MGDEPAIPERHVANPVAARAVLYQFIELCSDEEVMAVFRLVYAWAVDQSRQSSEDHS
jgi:hypothetical protein